MQCWNEEDKATRVSQVPGCSGFGQVLSVQSQASVSLHRAAPKATPSMERILGEQPEPGARRPRPGTVWPGLVSRVKMGTRRRLWQWLRCPWFCTPPTVCAHEATGRAAEGPSALRVCLGRGMAVSYPPCTWGQLPNYSVPQFLHQ